MNLFNSLISPIYFLINFHGLINFVWFLKRRWQTKERKVNWMIFHFIIQQTAQVWQQILSLNNKYYNPHHQTHHILYHHANSIFITLLLYFLNYSRNWQEWFQLFFFNIHLVMGEAADAVNTTKYSRTLWLFK